MNRIFLALIALLISTSAFAANLTTETASKWMDSMMALNQWGQSHPEYMKTLRENSRPDPAAGAMPRMPSFSHAVNASKAAGLDSQIVKVIAPYGFSSMEQWAQTGDQVMKAMMAMQLNKENIVPQIQEQMQLLQNDTKIPADQKQYMMSSMEQMLKMAEDAKKVPAADIAAVQPLADRFESMGQQQSGQAGR